MARPKGSTNKRTLAMKAKLGGGGDLPLDYMLRVMRDEGADTDRRDKMAAAAAPYLHAKLQAIEHSGKDGGPIQGHTAIEVSFVPAKRKPEDE